MDNLSKKLALSVKITNKKGKRRIASSGFERPKKTKIFKHKKHKSSENWNL